METHAVIKYHIQPFWDDSYKKLLYINEPFNDAANLALWTQQGYPDRFTGDMCDMRSTQPAWNYRFIEFFANLGWQDIGIAFYRMTTGTVMPVHQDLYKRYIELFDLQGQEHSIRRALLLLEDWKPGHYLEANGKGYINWFAGKTVEWYYDTPHMAANLGLEPRYSLQITGHL